MVTDPGLSGNEIGFHLNLKEAVRVYVHTFEIFSFRFVVNDIHFQRSFLFEITIIEFLVSIHFLSNSIVLGVINLQKNMHAFFSPAMEQSIFFKTLYKTHFVIFHGVVTSILHFSIHFFYFFDSGCGFPDSIV